MPTECGVALKEWGVVCEALRQGRQRILLRKGGIAEGSAGFQIRYDEFWLYPTQFHQDPAELVHSARDLLAGARARRPTEGTVPIDLLARVVRVEYVIDESKLADLAGQQILGDAPVRQRFHYKKPGLYVLHLELWERSPAVNIVETAAYAGCRSWVQLEQPISYGTDLRRIASG